MVKPIYLASASALCLLASAQAASAQEFFSGPYISGGVGANVFDGSKILIPDDTDFWPRMLDFDTGFAGSAALGAMIFPNFRVEGEISYRKNDLGAVTVQNEGPQPFTGGEASAFAAMVNGWIDIPVGSSNITPYIGGGIGGAKVSVDASTICPRPSVVGPCTPLVFDGSEFVLAFQLGAGVAIGEPTGPQLTMDYRYFGTADINVAYTGFFPDGTASGFEYRAHSFMIGFRVPIGK